MIADDIKKILNGDVSHIKQVNYRSSYHSQELITVTPKHVRKMLLSFLDGEIHAEELTDWADFIHAQIITERCACPEILNDNEDYYEAMLYVLQKLATPFLDGEITVDTTNKYLSELDVYE